jgi:hypothetical protein
MGREVAKQERKWPSGKEAAKWEKKWPDGRERTDTHMIKNVP